MAALLLHTQPTKVSTLWMQHAALAAAPFLG